MLNKLSHFIQYHNAIPIFFGLLFLGSGVALASNEAVRDTVLDSAQVLQSVDNSRIINTNLENYSVSIEITGVTEDDEFYYVTYLLNTIDIVDAVWSYVAKKEILQVTKNAIEGKDLGTHASKELAQVRDGELVRLKETQEIEKEIGESVKSVATVYTGLVGKFLEEKTEVFAGYQEVVNEQPAAPYPDAIVVNPQPNPTTDSVAAQEEAANQEVTPSGDTNIVVGDPTDTEPPTISILGNNPARVSLNTQYSDLGAFVSDNKSGALGYKTFVDGVEVGTVSLNTATTTTYVITYGAQDQVGNIATAQRTVEIFDPSVDTTIVENANATTTPAVVTPSVTTPEETATTTPAVDVPIEEEQSIATTTEPVVTTPEPTATTTPATVEADTATEEVAATSTETIIQEEPVTPSVTPEPEANATTTVAE